METVKPFLFFEIFKDCSIRVAVILCTAQRLTPSRLRKLAIRLDTLTLIFTIAFQLKLCDILFWIASMSKAVTSVAAMQLVEQGKLELDAPLQNVLPNLAEAQVLEGFTEDGTPRLRAPKSPITLRRLLTHTAGFTYDMWNSDMVRFMEQNGIPGIIECKKSTLRTPLVFDPGERWEYGINIDWVGQAVEAASGQSLNDYMKEHIFIPLGMQDTGFIIAPEARSRLAGMHSRNLDGSLTRIDFEVPQQPEFFMGGGGLYSTGKDYLTFLRALLGNGELNGVRILQPETTVEMGRSHIGDLNVRPMKTAIPAVTNDAEFFPGMVKKWGLGYMITTEDAPTGRSAGSLAWAGLANTYYWIDPVKRLTGVLLTQILPFADEQVLNLLTAFETAMYKEVDSASAQRV
ncbi:beta-lactamase family protein [Alicyclobacillus tolerans]|uniref:serine hydrolase domain-containing protein n=1 Tax=Alicyclobacillus tolerans TaxID=90970 RepID=UPI00235122F1|nr:serine hydrolase domain-containing protein [Alicyclobacillus tolerans]MCF8563178.1 beta-lactamase family protein [Alicyclobacillus tolerans]